MLASITSLMTGLSDIAVAAGLDKTADVAAVAASVADLAKAAKSTEPDPAKYVPIEQVTAMQGDLKSLRDSIQSDKAEELVSAAIEAGKLAPALKDWGLELARTDLKQFEAFTANAPSLTGAQLGSQKKAEDGAGDLSDADLEVMSQLGLSRDDMIAARTEDAA
ncbi:MAG: phage protease [Roseibium sp.]